MNHPLIDEINKLGNVTDNWTLLREILTQIVKSIPGLPFTEEEKPKVDIKKKK